MTIGCFQIEFCSNCDAGELGQATGKNHWQRDDEPAAEIHDRALVDGVVLGALFFELDKTAAAGGGYIHSAWRPARACADQAAF